jgi:hypothetical protein
MRPRTYGILLLIFIILMVTVPVPAFAREVSGDPVANAEEFLIYRFTAPPVREMTSQQLEEAGDMENKNPAIDLYGQDRYYLAAANKLRMEYTSTGKEFDSHYFSEIEVLFRKRSETLGLILDSPDLPPAKREEITNERANVDYTEQQAQLNYEKAYNKERAGQRSSSSGCLIVTATFGSPLASEVQLVRDYRDGTIRQSYSGSQFFLGFNAWYYSFSPAVAGYIATHPLVKSVMRVCLVPLLEIVLLSQNLHAILAFSPELATVSVLLFGAVFFSIVYIFPPAVLAVWLAGRNGRKVPPPASMRPVLFLWIIVFFGLAAGIILSFDLLTILSSGLLVACSVVLVAGTGSLALTQYLRNRPVRQS